jgi:hypothetical protein
MTDRAAPITLAGAPLGDTRHVCAFFGSEDEEHQVLLPFVKDGIDRGDKAVHVIDPARHDEHLRRLAAAGIDTTAAQARGQLELRGTTDTYLREGQFDQERMLAVFERLAGGDAARGFARSRIVCSMDWAAESRASVDDVIEFESRVNDVWRRHDDVVICTYRLAHFGGAAVIDIMRTHPMVIVGGTLQRNPFFVPPERFVPELRERRAARRAPRPPTA